MNRGLEEVRQKLREFGFLTEGWCYGEGEVISKEDLEKAAELAEVSSTTHFSEMDVFPSLLGGVSFCLYIEEDYYEYLLEDGKVFLSHSDESGWVIIEAEVKLIRAIEHIKSLPDIHALLSRI